MTFEMSYVHDISKGQKVQAKKVWKGKQTSLFYIDIQKSFEYCKTYITTFLSMDLSL